MTIGRLASIYNRLFFVGLLLAYLLVLFAFGAPHYTIAKTAFNIVAAVVEIVFFVVVCALLAKNTRHSHFAVSDLLYLAISLLLVTIYAAQTYSIYLSSSFISTLAIENREESRILQSTTVYIWTAIATVWWLIFAASHVSTKIGNPKISHVGFLSNRGRRPLMAAGILTATVLAILFTRQKDTGLLETNYLQTPVVSLVRSYYDLFRFKRSLSGVNRAYLASDQNRKSNEFPLRKNWIYHAELPFTATPAAQTPRNVIVVFTEGTSARLINAYGGKYPNLTPNLDRLAAHSLRVVNYYNHTAATYRGIQGQLVSGYPAAGGASDTAVWDDPRSRKTLASIRYQTVPLILRERGYKSYFISPHYDTVGLNALLRSLGFDHVFSFESVSHDIAPGNRLYYVEKALSDGDMFNALKILMSKKIIDDGKHPFFIGLYTFGTHAFLDVMPTGLKYGDGSNPTLNKLHNYDNELGKFLDYFFASAYAKNTILIITADHANFPDQPYRAVAGNDYKPLFVDRVPLLIYDPAHHLPPTYDAGGKTSIDFAPTLLQLLGINDETNSFVGQSLFDPDSSQIGFSAIGADFYATDSTGVYQESDLPPRYAKRFAEEKTLVETYYQLEKDNRIFSPPPQSEGR